MTGSPEQIAFVARKLSLTVATAVVPAPAGGLLLATAALALLARVRRRAARD